MNAFRSWLRKHLDFWKINHTRFIFRKRVLLGRKQSRKHMTTGSARIMGNFLYTKANCNILIQYTLTSQMKKILIIMIEDVVEADLFSLSKVSAYFAVWRNFHHLWQSRIVFIAKTAILSIKLFILMYQRNGIFYALNYSRKTCIKFQPL